MSKMHINLPARINKDQPVTARWANDLRESIYRLASRKIEQRGGMPGGGGTDGPFCRVFQSEGVWYLTGGTVTGGTGNVTVPDIDLGDVGSEPADGTFFWLVCSGDAVTEDDVLLAGFDLATATVGSGTSLPSNTIPTAVAPAGVLHVSLGSWSAGKFVPAGCGNLQISHCPGTLSYARG
jgi:hypothetical protein